MSQNELYVVVLVLAMAVFLFASGLLRNRYKRLQNDTETGKVTISPNGSFQYVIVWTDLGHNTYLIDPRRGICGQEGKRNAIAFLLGNDTIEQYAKHIVSESMKWPNRIRVTHITPMGYNLRGERFFGEDYSVQY